MVEITIEELRQRLKTWIERGGQRCFTAIPIAETFFGLRPEDPLGVRKWKLEKARKALDELKDILPFKTRDYHRRVVWCVADKEMEAYLKAPIPKLPPAPLPPPVPEELEE